MQFIHHGFGIGPVGLIKLPIALDGPVEEIDDDLVDLDALRMILPGYGKYLVLGTVCLLYTSDAADD